MQMQIPQTAMAQFSAKAKGYLEAGLKLAEGYRLIEEAKIELAHLDGKKLNRANTFNNAGGEIITDKVATLGSVRMTREEVTAHILKTLAKHDASTPEIARELHMRYETVRVRLAELARAKRIRLVGAGNQMKWQLCTNAPKAKATATKTVANKTTRRSKTSGHPTGRAKTLQQINAKPQDPEKEKADGDKIIEIIRNHPEISMMKLIRKTKKSFYPMARLIKGLIEAGRIRENVTKLKSGLTIKTWEVV